MSALVESINTTINANYPNTKVKSNLVDLLSRLNVELVSAKIMLANNKPIASDLITSFYPVFNKVISGLRVVLLDVKNNQKRFSSIFDSKTNDSINYLMDDITKNTPKTVPTIKEMMNKEILGIIDEVKKSRKKVMLANPK